jgi:hypothetical protein
MYRPGFRQLLVVVVRLHFVRFFVFTMRLLRERIGIVLHHTSWAVVRVAHC